MSIAKLGVVEYKQDSGYAWVILVASFLSNAITSSVFVSPAVYMVDWMEAFNTTKAQVTLTGSLHATLASVAGLFSGPLISQFGYRYTTMTGAVIGCIGMALCSLTTSITQLYICFGVILGLGHSMFFIPPILVTQFYFNKRRALASGISLSGHSAGSFIFMPILRILISAFGWRGTMLLHAGLVLQLVLLGALFRPFDLEKAQKTNQNKQKVTSIQSSEQTKEATTQSSTCLSKILKSWDWSLFKNSIFVLFLVSVVMAAYAIEVSYKLTALKAVTIGDVNKIQGSFLPAIMGLSSTTTRIFMSFIANVRCVNRTLILATAILLHSSGCIASTQAYDMFTYTLTSVICGIGIGSQMTVMTTTLTDLIGLNKIVYAQSFMSCAGAIALGTALPIAGLIIDETGNYDLPYYIYGAMGIASSGLMLAIAILQAKRIKAETLSVKSRRHSDLPLESKKAVLTRLRIDSNCESHASALSLATVG